MTEAFRQKLLNWFCTIGIILIATLLMPLQYWLITLREKQEFTAGPVELNAIAGQFGESFIYYLLMAPIAILWHLSDFIERAAPSAKLARVTTRYGPFFATVALGTLLHFLMTIRVWEYNSCDELPDALFWECIVYPSAWLSFPWVATILLALALCLFKAISSLVSLFKKAP